MSSVLKKAKDLVLRFWGSALRFSISQVLSRWLILFALFFVGSVILEAIANISYSDIWLSLLSRIQNEILVQTGKMIQLHMLRKALTALFLLVICLQINRKRKQNKTRFFIIEFPYKKEIDTGEKLEICNLRLSSLTDYKEIISAERDFIISCSPIPVVTAILGYMIQKTDTASFNWNYYIALCVAIVVIYLFFCWRNIKKRRELHWIMRQWEEAKSEILSIQLRQ